MTDPAIRVWLEPGYDYGRTGAWMLDLMGCFVWGPDEKVALARVPSAVGAYASWLAEHGERAAVPPTDAVAVVESVTPTHEGGYERNAIFAFDRRPVPAAELETALRRLDFARADLLALLDRLEAYETAHGPLPAAGSQRLAKPAGLPTSERESGGVLRHLGGAEVWLASRLAPTARYEGPPPDGDIGVYLAATRAWALEVVRRLWARDPALSGTDGKGEEWTLAKVLRRLVYHALDHLGELDRRLARAEGVADRLVYRKDVLVDPQALADLFRAVGWYRRVADAARLARMLEGTTEMVSAWDGERMVGFARAVSDSAFNAYVSTVAVHPRWQGRGVGERLIGALLERNEEIKFVLSAVPGLEGFYRSMGFEPEPHAMVRRRTR